MARHLLLAALLATGVAESWEHIVNRVGTKVNDEVGPGFEVTEVPACHHNSVRHKKNCMNMEPPMKGLEDARYMRVIYFLDQLTKSDVAASVSHTSVRFSIDLYIYHTPFLEDQHTNGFPLATIDFAGALAKVQSAFKGDFDLYEFSWCRPVHPCMTEDVYQFIIGKSIFDAQFVVCVCSTSHKACIGYR